MKQTRLTRRRFVLLGSTTALTGLAGCAESGAEEPSPTPERDESPTPTQSNSPTDTPATSSTTTDANDDAAVVEMVTDNQGQYFDPKGLHVEPGTTVQFVNESGSHGTTAYHPDNDDKPLRVPTDAEPWDSPLYSEPDQSFEVTFDVEGVYDYYCPPHESMGMVGRIIVGEPHDGPGTSQPEELPPGAQESLPAITDVLENGTISGP